VRYRPTQRDAGSFFLCQRLVQKVEGIFLPQHFRESAGALVTGDLVMLHLLRLGRDAGIEHGRCFPLADEPLHLVHRWAFPAIELFGHTFQYRLQPGNLCIGCLQGQFRPGAEFLR
jgi:hypothetical protein